MTLARLSSQVLAARAGYAAAVLGAVGVLGLDRAIAPHVDGYGFLLLYVPVVLIAAGLGGAGPAILAGGLCLLLGTVADNRWPDQPADQIDLLAFGIITLLIAAASSRLRREAREARARRLHLESIMRTVPDAMVVIDDQGVIASFSAAATRVFGWSAEEAIGRNVSLLMPEPDRSRHDAYLARYLETGDKTIIGVGRVVTGLRKDGSVFPLELAIGETEGGDDRHFTGFMRDITDRRAQEQRLRVLQTDLAHASRVTAMGQMASALAHEINQPLAAIANYMQAASDMVAMGEPDPDRLRIALDGAADQALRAGEIIRHLRAFVDKGRASRSVVEPGALIEGAMSLALIGIGEHKLRLDLHLDPDLPPVIADPVQIQQVMVNLVRNALDATPDTRLPELTIHGARGDNGDIAVTVADRGVGFRGEEVDQLFDPFVSGGGGGLGLGLSICRTIIDAHGGQLTARRRTGGGAAFTFTLPCAEPGPGHP